jgi:hypothetical protein
MISDLRFAFDAGATRHCSGTPHSCGSEPAQFNIQPDKSGVPAETMQLDFLQYQDSPSVPGTRAPDLHCGAGHGKLRV